MKGIQSSFICHLSRLTLSFWTAHKETLLPDDETSFNEPQEWENTDSGHAIGAAGEL